MDFGILGPLAVQVEGRPVDLGGRRQRAVLAMLLVDANRVVSLDRLIDRLWGEEPPPTATTALQVYVSHLRRVLEPARRAGSAPSVLVTEAPGYRLVVDGARFDAACFEAEVASGVGLLGRGRPAEASAVLRRALGRWRGPVLADFQGEAFAMLEAARLEELRLVAVEERFAADLALGAHREVVGELEAQVAAFPYRERLWGLLMVALYRSQRQADALAAFTRARRVLAEELGLDPGPELRRLENEILAHSPTLDWQPPAAEPAVADGQIVVSEAAATLLGDAVPDGVWLQDLGQHRLKDLGRAEHISQSSADGLDTGFPPLRSLDDPELKQNLPVQLTSFVGREHELGEIHRLLDESRLVTLVGPGGSGKTRLALQVAADLLDGSGDGVWLVDLSPVTAGEQVAREVASVLGVREAASRPLDDTLVESLQYRNLFLVLDNCEQVIDAAAKLAEAVVRQCRKVSVLATSRQALGVHGERVFRVPPLGLPEGGDPAADLASIAGCEAVRLFVARAQEHRSEFVLDAANAASVVSVCRHLDGIPLALELAAARVRSMSVQDIERRLGQPFRLLSSPSRTRSARQQTMLGAVAWSHDLLNDVEKRVFACLAVFPASFDLSAAESVCVDAGGLDQFDAVDLVQSLVDKSLLQTEQAATGFRYRMLETIAQYAADRLAEAGDATVAMAQEAHASYYLGVVEDAAPYLTGSDQAHWGRKLEADYDNIRTAIQFLSTSPGRGSEASRMVAALHRFWSAGFGGAAGEVRDLATAALAHPQAQPVTKERSRALLGLGIVQNRMGQDEAARASLEAGLAIAREVGDAALTAEHLCVLAGVAAYLGDYRHAREAATEALAMADTVGDPNLQAWAHDRIGVSETVADADAARLHFAEAVRLFERAGDRQRIGMAYTDLANLEMTVGDLAAARTHLEAALEHVGATTNRAHVLLNLGFVNAVEGDLEAAGSHYRDALRHAVRLGHLSYTPYILLGLAVCASASGNPQRSAVLHGAADATLETHGHHWEPAEAALREKDVAALRQRTGNPDFETAYMRGHQLNGPDAIALALQPDTAGPAHAAGRPNISLTDRLSLDRNNNGTAGFGY